MEKEYLGLGVVFNALDQGFTKSVEGVKKVLQGAGDAMGKLTAAASENGGKIFGELTEGFKLLSLSRIGNTLENIQSGIAGTGHGINEAAKDLDMMRAKMTAALDPKVAANFTGQMMGMTRSFGLTATQADTIAHNLLNSGVEVSKMGDTLPVIGTLVGKLGMDAGQVSDMFGQMQGYLHMSGRQASGLTKTIFKLQKEYKLTNLMETLPEIVGNVYDNMLKLGKSSPEIANRMVQDVTRMAAAFQKMGMSQSKATQTATSFNDKMTEVQQAFKDLQAGLDPQSNIIQDIYDAFGSGGLNATDLISAIKSGKMTNEDIMKKMQGMVSGLGDQQRTNVMQRLRRTFGDDISNMIGPMAKNFQDVNKEAATQAKKVGTADDAWKSLTGQLDGTLSVSEKLKDSAKAYLDTLATLMSKGNILQGLSAITNAADEQATQVGNLESMWGKAYRALTTYQAVGLSGLVPAGFANDVASVGLWAEQLGKLIFPITSLLGILTILKTPFSWLLKAFELVGPAIEVATDVFLGVTAAMESAGGILAVFGEIALDVVTGPIGWVIGAITLLIAFWGKLTKIVSYFNKDAGAKMKSFGETVGKVWDAIVDGVSYLVTTVINYFKFLGTTMMLLFDIWWHVGSAVWGLLSKAVGAFVDFVSEQIGGITSWLVSVWNSTSTAVIGAFTTMFDGLKKAASAVYQVLKPILDPVLNFFGTIKDQAGAMLGGIWDMFLSKFNSVKDLIMVGVSKITNIIPDWLKNDVSSITSAFGHILNHEDKSPSGTMAAVSQAAGTMVSGPQVGGTVAPGADLATSVPIKAQLGAPTMANIAGVDLRPTQSPKLDDKNFQAVVDMLASMKDAIVQAVVASGGKDVKVEIVGDMRKFMAVQKHAAASEAGTGGMNAALGG